MNQPQIPEPQNPKHVDSQSTSRPSVLVIDDEVGLRDVLSYGLQRRGYEVTCAPDAETALRLVREKPFDLAICDIMMPGSDGLSVLGNLKRISPDIEVIMATGYATLETAILAMKKGAYDYISKPFSLNLICALLEKALEHRQLKAKVDHLEEVSRLKSEFMAVMNHELRTPIAAISGFVSLLLNGVYGELNPRQTDSLRRVITNSNNLFQLVNDVLDFSKLSANRMNLSEDLFDLVELAREVIGFLEPLAREKGLSIGLETTEDLWTRTDRTKLKQVLINLLGNSIKFTKNGGVVLRLASTADPGQVMIQVADTGVGIKKDDLPLLFQEFRQLDSSSTREHGGTGLGLCITKKIVELMGGAIRVESEFETGTTMHLNLTIRTAPPSAITTGVGPATRPGKKLVLGIDDDPSVLKLLADSLESTDFQFVGASSGPEGLALARQLHPKMITLDIMMPHMDGWSVLQMLKADPELKDIPVFIVSIVDNKPLAFSLGVREYLVKPFSREQLLEKLNLVHNDRTLVALVVDDDAAVRAMVSTALQEERYVVETADSGEEAIRQLAQLAPDILLLDLVMPNVSGFDVLHAIESLPLPEMVTIVMADDDLSPDQLAYLEQRVQAVLKKKSAHVHDIIKTVKEGLGAARRAA